MKFRNELVRFNTRLETDSTQESDLTKMEVRFNTKWKGDSTPNGSEIQHQMEVRFNNPILVSTPANRNEIQQLILIILMVSPN